MDNFAEMLSGAAVGGLLALRVVLDEDLGTAALALGDCAEIEARVEEFTGGELAEREG